MHRLLSLLIPSARPAALRYLLGIALLELCFTSSVQADVENGTYVGSSKTIVKYLDPRTLQTVSKAAYGKKVEVVILARKTAGGQVENNPFSISISPVNDTDGPRPGQLFAASARAFTVNGSPVLVQYWVMDNTDDGFVGVLANNHSSEGLARDRIGALLGGPGGEPRAFRMHDAKVGAQLQCRMSATATGKDLLLQVAGYAFVPNKAVVRFNTTINAKRP